jgi:hypothetical protein
MPAAPDVFEDIIRHQSARELVPWLLTLKPTEVAGVRQRFLALTKALLAQGHGGTPDATWQQRELMFFLAALATYSRSDMQRPGLSRTGFLETALRDRGPDDPTLLVQAVLDHYRPAWFTEWLVGHVRRNPWVVPSFGTVHDLVVRGVLAPDEWLLAQATAHQLVAVGQEARVVLALTAPAAGQLLNPLQQLMLARLRAEKPQLLAGPAPLRFAELVLAEVQAQAALLRRGVPLLFEFDTPLDAMSTSSGERQERLTLDWLSLLPRLVASGHLDRGELLTRSLLALRRDFRRPLLTWFKNLYLSLLPSPAERLARQAELLELLAQPQSLVVNFALDQLKDVWTQPGFDPDPLLRQAEGLVSRPDLKTGLKALLAGLDKLARNHPDQVPALARLQAAALAHADAAVQQRAAQGLTTLLGAHPPRLSPAETADLLATVATYADLLPPAARKTLGPWLSAAPPAAPPAAPVGYAPCEEFVPELSAATAIAPVADWHELLFLTGPVLRADDPAAFERWLDGLLRLRRQFPADYPTLLHPYLYQAFPETLRAVQPAGIPLALAQHRFPAHRNGPRELIQALLLGWGTRFEQPAVARVSLVEFQYGNPDPLLRVEQARLLAAETLLRTAASPLPLLSTPTHAPHWVAPSALVAKLVAYEAASQEPAAADLALALARTAWRAEADAAAARQALPALRHQGVRSLLEWFSAPAAAPKRPVPLVAPHFAVAAGLPPVPTGGLAEALPWLAAVAARTRYSLANLPELHPLADYPGLAAPWQPGWEFVQRLVSYQENAFDPPVAVTRTWQELYVPTEHEGQAPPCSLLLYSLHARLPRHDYYYLAELAASLPFLLALVPGNPAPLHWHALRTACRTDTTGAEGRLAVEAVLRSLLSPGPAFAEPSTVLLAVGLTHAAPACRALALEVLLAAAAQYRLVPAALGSALGQLLAAEFVPVSRFADQLTQARGVAPATDDALRQLLEALLPALPAAPLRQTGALLTLYADLPGRATHPVPAPVQARLREWSASASLKKLVAPLLA